MAAASLTRQSLLLLRHAVMPTQSGEVYLLRFMTLGSVGASIVLCKLGVDKRAAAVQVQCVQRCQVGEAACEAAVDLATYSSLHELNVCEHDGKGASPN
jgi:hypothetical protein